MDADDKAEEFSLNQRNIIKKLKNRDWFVNCIGHNTQVIAYEWDCHAQLSARRIGEAYDYWVDDTARTLKTRVKDAVELDHFKYAAFLSFWLRRRFPINETRSILTIEERDKWKLSDEQEYFLEFGNELSSFLIGFEICIYYEEQKKKSARNTISISKDSKNYLRNCTIDPGFLHDIVITMKHKSISPYGLYLTYKSLFTHLVPPR